MPWRYKMSKNTFGHDQIFDCSQSPKVPVCSSCHMSYTNIGRGNQCSDCTGVHDEDTVDTGQTTEEILNEFGFTDHALVENGLPVYYTKSEIRVIVCPQCMAMTIPNRGNGTLCSTCRNEFDTECQHDM